MEKNISAVHLRIYLYFKVFQKTFVIRRGQDSDSATKIYSLQPKI